MPRVPTRDEDSPADFARFTFEEWEALDGYYDWWIQRWKRTLDFIRDQHWRVLRNYDRNTLPDWRSFPLIPLTLAFYNDYLTDYLKSEVRFSALPASPEPSDIDAAELAEQVLKYQWNVQNMDRKRIDKGAWLMATGTAVLRIFWDTNTGDLIPLGVPTPDGGMIPVDPDTFRPDPQRQQPEMVDAGEIGVEVISPQFVRWARSPSKGVMVGMLLTEDEVVDMYGEDVAGRMSYSDSHAGLSSDLNRIEQPGITPRRDERTLVIEHYIPPSSRHPKGLWWTAAGDGRELLTGPWDIPIGRIPIVSFRWIPVPGEKHLGLSPLYGMTFQNKQYEQILSKIMEWYKKANPVRMLKKGGGINKGDIQDEPFQEVKVNPGAEPEMMDVADAPQGLFRMLGQTQADMLLTSGKQFAQEDTLPEGLAQQTFRRPDELKKDDATALAFINAKSAWQEVGEIILSYVADFYTEPRVIAVQGPDKSFQWTSFQGSDLTDGQNLAATIRVDEKSLFPWNRQAQRDSVIAMLQSDAGQLLFSDAEGGIDIERVQAAMQAVGVDVGIEMLDPDILEARNEEMEFRNLSQGQEPPQPEMWQNHATHLDQHERLLKSQKFRGWSEEARQAFLQHVQETQDILNQQAEEEREQMIELERAMRQVREEEELRADVIREWAQEFISLLSETTGLQVQSLLGILEDPTGFELTAQPRSDGGSESENS